MPKSKKPNTNSDDNQAQPHGFGASVELEQLHRKVNELTEALQRERADGMNIRRQHSEQLANIRSHAIVEVVEQLLPVIDNFERSLKHVPDDLQNNEYVKGVKGVVKQFETVLTAMGVTRIPTVDQPFDPHLHEAVGVEDGDGDTELVSEELQAGYQMANQVIRPAMVKVRRT